MDEIATAVETVRGRIEAAAGRAGRDPAEVTLLAATKTVAPERIVAALAAGVTDLGENRAQELVAKAERLAREGPRWHFVGALQRNKVRSLARWVSCWQTVDRAALGVEIARRAPGARVLVEVNLGGEAQKAGVAPEGVPGLVEGLTALDLDVRGLMAIPPRRGERRRWFAALRGLAERTGLSELSMGMSEDYEQAVAEGSTIVRIGRAIFGER